MYIHIYICVYAHTYTQAHVYTHRGQWAHASVSLLGGSAGIAMHCSSSRNHTFTLLFITSTFRYLWGIGRHMSVAEEGSDSDVEMDKRGATSFGPAGEERGKWACPKQTCAAVKRALTKQQAAKTAMRCMECGSTMQLQAPKGPEHKCTNCGAPLYTSEALIQNQEDPDHDWQGEIAVVCLKCYNEYLEKNWQAPVKKRDFKRMADSAWQTRTVRKTEQSQLIHSRVKDFKTAQKKTPQRAGESRQQWRQRVIGRLPMFAVTIATSFLKEPEEVQKERLVAIGRWRTEAEKEAKDPTYVPNIDTPKLADCAAQHFTKISEGIDDFFFCRRRDCLLVAPNHQWPNNNGGQYACPHCANQYSPWLEKPGLVKANKVLCIEIPDGHDFYAVMGKEFRSLSDRSQAKDGKIYWIMPFLWPDTKTTNMQNEFKTIAARIDDEVAEMSKAEQIAYVKDKLENHDRRAVISKQVEWNKKETT